MKCGTMTNGKDNDYIIFDHNNRNGFEDYILIMPDLSVGNVGQLTLDLLLNNLEAVPIGRISHPCFIPLVGDDPFRPGSPRLVTSCEIYECQDKKLIFIQIRSGILPGRKSEYKNLIVDFIERFKFKMTILIGSSYSEFFPREKLEGVPLHYLCTSKFSDEESLKQLNFKKFSLPDGVYKKDDSDVPGSLAAHFLLINCEEKNIPLVVLLCICSEGNNYPEALEMVASLNSWLKIKEEGNSRESWRMPVSWNLPYGCDAPSSIY